MASSISEMRSEYMEIGRAKKPTTEQKERYKELSRIIIEAAKVLKREEITVYHHVFDGTAEGHFSFYYAEKQGQTRLIPISEREANTINYQIEQPEGCTWPILNPETNELFVPICKVETVKPTDALELGTEDFFRHAIHQAETDKNSKEYRIMQALQPYAKAMHRCVGVYKYNKVVQLFPDYPDSYSLLDK